MKAILRSLGQIFRLLPIRVMFIILTVILLGSAVGIAHYELTHETKAPTLTSKPPSTSTLCVMGEKGCGSPKPKNPEANTQSTNSNTATSTPQVTPQENNVAQSQPSNTAQEQQYSQEIAAAEAQCTSNDEKSITDYTNTVEAYAADLYQLEESDSSNWNSQGQSEVNSFIVEVNNGIHDAYEGTVVDLGVCTPSSPVTYPTQYQVPSCNATDGSELQTCATQIYSQSGIP